MPLRLANMLVSLLLALALSTPTAVAIPPTFNATNTPSFFLRGPHNNDPQHGCSKVGFLRTDRRPSWSECYRAIRNLPDTHNSGTFHTSGYNDVWRLPRTESWQYCRAQVEIQQRARAPSSWIAVKAALDELNNLCRRAKSGDQPDRTGGWMLMTTAPKIKVSLLGPGDPDSIGPPMSGVSYANSSSLVREIEESLNTTQSLEQAMAQALEQSR